MPFLPLPADRVIVANGTYVIGNKIPGSSAIVEWAGSLGAAAATVGRASLAGDFAAYRGDDGNPLVLTTPADLWVVAISRNGTVLLQVTGADGTTAIQTAVTRLTDE